jgi:outer membrane autotransporter protein
LFSGDRKEKSKENPWGIYTDYVGNFGSQNSSVNQTGYDFNISGFNSGIDYRFRDNLILGVGTGYYHTATTYKGSGGSGEVNSIPFYLYGTYCPGPFYVLGTLGYTLNLYSLERNINFGGINRKAESSVDGGQLNVSGEIGFDFDLRGFNLNPAVSLFYAQSWVGGFTESGADSLNLQVKSQNATSLQTGVGARLARPFKAGKKLVIPEVSAFYQHEFSNDSRGLDARFAQSGSNFTFRTDSPQRDYAIVGAGVAVGLKKNLFIRTNYNAEVGRGKYTSHFVSAGLRLEF